MALHEVAFALEPLQAFGPLHKFARIGEILLHQFLHLLLDLLQIFRREGSFAIKIVEEPVLGRRPVTEFGLREKFENCGRHQMRRRMPIHLKRFRILLGDDAEVGILLQRPGQINQIAIGLRGQSCVRQARTDRFGYIERG